MLFHLRKKILCGACCGVLTNGYNWIFIIVKLNNDYNGGSYNHSAVVKIRTLESFDGQVVISKPWPDLIADILSHWVSLILIHMTEY